MGTRSRTGHQPYTLTPSGPRRLMSPTPAYDTTDDGRPLFIHPSDRSHVVMPSLDETCRRLEENGHVRFPAECSLPTDQEPVTTEAVVRGYVTVTPTANNAVDADFSGFGCSCGLPLCRHQTTAAADIEDWIGAHRLQTANQRRAARDITADLASDRQASELAQQAAVSRWEDGSPSYSEDFDAFRADYHEALARQARGENPVPYMTEDATGGIGARDGGRGFGVELEFDLPGVRDRQGAMDAIGRDLHAAGLTRRAAQGRYHDAERTGYSDDPSGWSLEADVSVGGELVSPILYDEPRSWQALHTACDIIKRHGGRATVYAGGHVHVSLHDFDHTVENHNRLLGMVSSYQDTLYRLASNPERRSHRGLEYCSPNRYTANGYVDIADARFDNSGHSIGVNLQAVVGRPSDHIEYRMWDGSLDPGTIQTQVKLSLGITEAAFRTARNGPSLPDREPVGSHHNANPGRGRLTGRAWQDATASYRSLADAIFHRAQDKAQATSLFATTRWPQANSRYAA